MRSELVLSGVLIFAVLVVGFFVAMRKRSDRTGHKTSTRSSGPNSLHYVCTGCSVQFTHSRRTIGAWEKGTRRFFCSNCHSKWRDKQTPKEVHSNAPRSQHKELSSSRSSGTSSPLPAPQTFRRNLAPARSGCLTVVLVLIAIPVFVSVVATYA